MSKCITAEVCVDIDDFSPYEIIEAACDVIARDRTDLELISNIVECLIERMRSGKINDADKRKLKTIIAWINVELSKSLEDELKEEMMKEYIAKYSLFELTQKLK